MKTKSSAFQVSGQNEAALFTLKLHRGEGMTLVAMNWKRGTPPKDFVGFAIEYKEPGGNKFFPVKNRLSFLDANKNVGPNNLSSRLSPIQKFRWVHFPRNAEMQGEFIYRVTPVFMNENDELSYGEFQEAPIVLMRETYPDKLNVAFTRGFVSSQAFVDRYESQGDISTLIPSNADGGLTFKPTHPKTKEALAWMGFEARQAILDLLDDAIKDKTAKVQVVAYDLNEVEVVNRLVKIGKRLQIIIDDNDHDHGKTHSAETQAEKKLKKSAGKENVKRQHMGTLQHNKTIVVSGKKIKKAVCGSTNYSWRGFYIQNNNAIILNGTKAIKPFQDAFINYWNIEDNSVSSFANTDSAEWNDLGFNNINASVSFSPHKKSNALLTEIANDIAKTKSSLFFSLAFLYQTKGPIRKAVTDITKDKKKFVYGISDKEVGGFDLLKPDGNMAPVSPAVLNKHVPEPFKSEPSGGKGIRMHHKFVVIDFDKPTARVYMGSYNFSGVADTSNGENLLLIKDQKIAVSYMVEAVRIFDHYHFRLVRQDAKDANKPFTLAKPPRGSKEKTWWEEDYKIAIKIKDRELFA